MILHYLAGSAHDVGTGPLCGVGMGADMTEDRERVTCSECRIRLGVAVVSPARRADVHLDTGEVLRDQPIAASLAIPVTFANPSVGDAKPVTWARRRALDAVMAWARDRERERGAACGPEREYVNVVTGVTEITGAGKVYATEAVDRMERLLVDLGVPEMLALLRWAADQMLTDQMHPKVYEMRALLARIEKRGDRG